MNQPDYIYIFNDFTDTGNDVRMIIPSSGKCNRVQANINERDFIRRRQRSKFPAIIADLIDLAVSVWLADWLSKQRGGRQYKIRIELPVRHPEILGGTDSIKMLTKTMRWYTEDNWEFVFHKRIASPRRAESQPLCLPDDSPVEVALWSGGLDSFAGAFNRISDSSEKDFTLFGTGSNKNSFGVQKELADILKPCLGTNLKYMRLPFSVSNAKKIKKNRLLRSRGFTNVLLGVACACLENQNYLYIYENGIGAINLPYTEAEAGLDHSRAVH
ncbi:unnamed protein product, partial [marine sediment metagenome]